MNTSSVKEFIRTHDLGSKKLQGKRVYFSSIEGYLRMRDFFHPDSPTYVVVHNRSGEFEISFSKKEMTSVFTWIQHVREHDRGFLDTLNLDWSAVHSSIQGLHAEIQLLDDQPKQEIVLAYLHNVRQLIRESSPFGAFSEVGNVYSLDYLIPEMAKAMKGVSGAKVKDVFLDLVVPLGLSLGQRFEKAKHELILAYPESILKSKTLEEAEEHTGFIKNFVSVYSRFSWSTVSESGNEPISKEGLFAELKKMQKEHDEDALHARVKKSMSHLEQAEHSKSVHLNEYQFPEEIIEDISILQKLLEMRNDYEEAHKRLLHSLHLLIRKASLVLDVPVELLEWIDLDELIELFDSNELDIDKVKANRDSFAYVYYWNDDGVQMYSFNDDEIDEVVYALREAHETVLKGFVASLSEKNVLTGRAVIIDSPSEQIRKGDILVLEKLSVDHVSLFKNAAALLVDEGGITSHAAVLSREYNIPCIIGLSTVTKYCETGDILELNFDTGEVHKK